MLDCQETLSHKFPVFYDLIKYISITQQAYEDLCSENDFLSLPLNKTICMTAYGKYASHILELLENDYASCSTHDRMLSILYPLQHKLLLFDKELMEKCVTVYETCKKSPSAKLYPAQENFKRILKKFHLEAIEEILFPECTKKRKSYRIPICSFPSLAYIFLIYHQTFLPLETQFSVLSDAFINIAVSKKINLPSILNILCILKKGFESYKFSFLQNAATKLPYFFQEPSSPTTQNNLIAQDIYYISTCASKEYSELFEKYSSKIDFLKTYRKIEKCILNAYMEWHHEPKNKVDLDNILASIRKISGYEEEALNPREKIYIKIAAKKFTKYLNPILPDFDLTPSDLNKFVDQFLVKFKYAERLYTPIPSEELFHLSNSLDMLDWQMLNKLECLIYFPSTADPLAFFAPSPLSKN